MADSSNSSSSISFLSLLALSFIILKLCKVIQWAWLWVLSPIWIPLAIALLACAIYFLYLWYISSRKKKRLKEKVGVMEIPVGYGKSKVVMKSKMQQRIEAMQQAAQNKNNANR